MLAVQTAGLPPNHGKIILLITGCTWKRRNAPQKDVAINARVTTDLVLTALRT
ncbi:MAG: hypothetical protein ACPGMQ_08495 [Pirellulales bacterium]